MREGEICLSDRMPSPAYQPLDSDNQSVHARARSSSGSSRNGSEDLDTLPSTIVDLNSVRSLGGTDTGAALCSNLAGADAVQHHTRYQEMCDDVAVESSSVGGTTSNGAGCAYPPSQEQSASSNSTELCCSKTRELLCSRALHACNLEY